MDNWERGTGCVRPPSPSEGAGEGLDEPQHNHPPSGRKGKKGDKHGVDKATKEDKKAAKEKEQVGGCML